VRSITVTATVATRANVSGTMLVRYSQPPSSPATLPIPARWDCIGCHSTCDDKQKAAVRSHSREIGSPIVAWIDEDCPGFRDDLVPFYYEDLVAIERRNAFCDEPVAAERQPVWEIGTEDDAARGSLFGNGEAFQGADRETLRLVLRAWRSCKNGEAGDFSNERIVPSWAAITKALHESYVTFEDGSSYMGQFMNDTRHGHGVWRGELGQYDGQWEKDLHHGEGRLLWFNDGRTYEGQFREGRFHGRGHFEWRSQQGLVIYEGQYVDDAKHGNGRLEWPDGRTYEGGWSEGKREGEGTFYKPDGWHRQGIWEADRLVKWTTQPPTTLRPAPPVRSGTNLMSNQH